MRELSALNNYFGGAYYFSRPRHQGIALLAAGAASQTKSVSPPSLWPGRELREYHCPSCASWRNAGATRILLLVVLTANQTDRRSTQLECTGSGLFDFQGAGKHRGCPYTSKYGQLFRSIHSQTRKFQKMPASDIPKPAFASNLKF